MDGTTKYGIREATHRARGRRITRSEIKPREMLLDPIVPEQGLAMLYSYRGIGKTFLSRWGLRVR